MTNPRPIELLAPARDLPTAREAIAHGADAIYIGAPRFGARASAGVPIEDIRQLCYEAHLYGVRVYVTLNTILYDSELRDAEALTWELYRCGVDALIVQDMAMTKMALPPIPLHASTQCDTTEPEDVQVLEALGFEQVVLARELNVEQIRRVRAVTSIPLEVFVHGALCVSYSGRCYLSEDITDRSANRGECSQQCRLPYDLRDSAGTLIRKGEHLLSPRDMNRSALLEDILEAGASSLKIEGRLKGVSYVKNITAHYRKELDKIIARYPERYRRSSYGKTRLGFTPDPVRSFNRGFTPYIFEPRTQARPAESVINRHSPKSQGQYLGTVTAVQGHILRIDTKIPLANGDGLLYITPSGESAGAKVNKILLDGRVELARRTPIPVGSRVWRNYDQDFERLLSAPSARRVLGVRLCLRATAWGIALDVESLEIERLRVSVGLEMTLEPARRFDYDRIRSELSRLGDTPLVAEEITFDLGEIPPFIPISLLGGLRRDAAAAFIRVQRICLRPDVSAKTQRMPEVDRACLSRRPHFVPDYRANIANHLSRAHYQEQGYAEVTDAYELMPQQGAALMTTKHCIRHELGYCTRETREHMPYTQPLYLEQGGNRLRLEFDCARCQMLLYKD